jgi:hypothetical protein
MRRCAALIAAYALALQAILSAFAVQIARADAPAFEICTRDTGAGRARDPGHALCPACLAGHCCAATPVHDAVVAAWPAFATALPPALVAGTKPPADRRHRSHAPRAPPLG